MSVAACIDCGETSERLLADRFPHICAACLFPPRKVEEDPTADAPEYLPVVSLIQKLQTLNTATGAIAPDQKRMDGGW